jgi:hypothetical protein
MNGRLRSFTFKNIHVNEISEMNVRVCSEMFDNVQKRNMYASRIVHKN